LLYFTVNIIKKERVKQTELEREKAQRARWRSPVEIEKLCGGRKIILDHSMNTAFHCTEQLPGMKLKNKKNTDHVRQLFPGRGLKQH